MAHLEYSDEELTAWLDGEADFAPYDDISAAVEADTSLAARVEALRIDKGALAAAFEPLTPASKAPELERTALTAANENVRSFGTTTIAAALAACLVLGIFVGRLSGADQPAGWMEYVAAYQALYTDETLLAKKRDDAALGAELARVSSRIGKPVALADLRNASDLIYRRSQILGFEGKALAQFAFVTKDGVPVALCVLRAGEKASGLSVQNMEGMQSASWSDGEFQYLLIGGDDPYLIERSATIFRDSSVKAKG